MEFLWLNAVRLLHVVAAATWFGGIAVSTLVLGPAVKASGPVGGQFMNALQKRGGFARVMGPAAAIVLLTGLLLYWRMGYHEDPFGTTPAAVLTVGAILGVAGWLFGLVAMQPLQGRMKAISAQFSPEGPTPAQTSEMASLGAKMASRGRVFVALITLGFLLMAGRNVFV